MKLRIWGICVKYIYCYGCRVINYVVAGYPLLQPGFEPRSGHVIFVMGGETLGQVLCVCFGFPCEFSTHELLHIH
jgi:hypothetical protein